MSRTSVFSKTSRYRNFRQFSDFYPAQASGWRGALKDLATQHEVPLILGAASAATMGAGAYAHHRDPESKLGRNLGIAGGLGLAAAGSMGLGGHAASRALARQDGNRVSELARDNRAYGRLDGYVTQVHPRLRHELAEFGNIKGFGGSRPISRYQTLKFNNESVGEDIRAALSPRGRSLRSYGSLMKSNWGIPLAAAGAATAGGGMVADHMGYDDAGNIAKGVGGLAAAVGVGRTLGAGLRNSYGTIKVPGTSIRALDRQYIQGMSEGVHAGKVEYYHPRAPLMRKPPGK